MYVVYQVVVVVIPHTFKIYQVRSSSVQQVFSWNTPIDPVVVARQVSSDFVNHGRVFQIFLYDL